MGSENSVGRGVALILAGGIALGLIHNWLGLASHPPRGIAWRASQESMPSLESLAPPDSAALPDTATHAARPEAATPGPNVAPPSSAHSPSPAAAATTTPAHTPKPKPAQPPTQAPTPAGQTSSPTSAAPPPTSGSAARLPYIPAMARPVEAKLATVRLFFDAGAALFIDARDASEYEAGHIPGAIRMTQADFLSQPDAAKTLPVAGRPIIAYCEGGECEASKELAQSLVDAGFRKVLVYTGGFPEWAAAGNAVERGSGKR